MIKKLTHSKKTRNLLQGESTESNSERQAKHIYQILLIISVVLNGFLAIRTQWNTERLNKLNEQKTTLETVKTDLENQVLLAKSLPSFSFSRIRYELGTFELQLKKGKLLPFFNNLKDYRIVQNEIFDSVERGLKATHKGSQSQRTITFLVIANVGTTTAYSIKTEDPNGNTLELGDLLQDSAILIPIDHLGDNGTSKSKIPISFSSLRFEVLTGTSKVSHQISVPPPVAQSWVPVLGSIRGIGRANVTVEDSHIKNVLPKKSP